jgi:L-alanine-DL-glutamate epimerase-like enolase superfamily enzyme
MSLGGFGAALAVGHLAGAAGVIDPHQSGGPVQRRFALQLAACVPNFLIQSTSTRLTIRGRSTS